MGIKVYLVNVILIIAICVSFVQCKKSTPEENAKQSKVISVKVVNSYGQNLNGVSLSLKKGNTEIRSGKTGYDGMLIFSQLPLDAYTISTHIQGYVDVSEKLSFAASDTLSIQLELKSGTAYLDVLSEPAIAIGPRGGGIQIEISSNSQWVISDSGDWMDTFSKSGSGNQVVTLQVQESAADSIRKAEVHIQCGELLRKIEIIQYPPTKILAVTPKPGNVIAKEPAVITLDFNKPVKIHAINPGYQLCISPVSFSSGFSYRHTFTYGCGKVGYEYPFTVSVEDSLGERNSQDINVAFYENMLLLSKGGGDFFTHFVSDEDNTYWIATKSPNELHQISMATFQVLKKYALPGEISTFTVSPYNGKIYYSLIGVPKLYIMDKSGTLESEIEIVHDKTRTEYERRPRIYPMRILFTKSGKGLIWLSEGWIHDYNGYWYIDAKQNHKIWYEPINGAEVNYAAVYLNYDKTKIVLDKFDGGPEITTWDPVSMTMQVIRPQEVTRGGFLVASRKNANVYSAQLYNQLVVNTETNFQSKQSFLDNRSVGSADFSYRPGQELTIYFFAAMDGTIEIMDYSKAQSPIFYNSIIGLQGIASTLDGKHVIAFVRDGNGNVKIYQFPGSWFDY